MTPVDLLLVEGFKRDPHDKLEMLPAAHRQAAALRRTTRASSRSRATCRCSSACACRCSTSTTSAAIADFIVAIAASRAAKPRGGQGLMAQLSDDCFAFGGRLMRVDEALKLLGERIVPVTDDRDACRSPRARPHPGRGPRSPRAACRRTTIPPSTATRSIFDDLDAERRNRAAGRRPRRRRPSAGPAGRSAATRCASSPARRCPRRRRRPDTVMMQEDCRRRRTARCVLPPGIKRGANRRKPARTSRRAPSSCTRGRRLRAAGYRPRRLDRPDRRCRCSRAAARGAVLDRRRAARAGRARAARRHLRCQPLHAAARAAGAARLRGHAISASCPTALDAIRDALAERRRQRTISIVTSGGVSTGDEDHVQAPPSRRSAGSISGGSRSSPGRPIALGQVRPRAVRRPARQSGRGDGDVPAHRAAADPAPRRAPR